MGLLNFIYTILWGDGSSDIVEGSSFSQAFKDAGYTQKDRQRLSFWFQGDDEPYVFNDTLNQWEKEK